MAGAQTRCASRIVMGDQGISYCPDCSKCECCTPNFEETHGHLDRECVWIDLHDDGQRVCIYVDEPDYPNHVCQSSEVEPSGGETTAS